MYVDILTTLTYWKPLRPAINVPEWLFQTSSDVLFPNVAAAHSWQNLSPQGRPETEHAVQQVLTPKSNQRKPHQLPKRILICWQESRESFVFGQLCKKTSAFYLGSFTSKISWKNSSLSSSMTALLDRLPRCKVSHKQSEWTWTLDIVCSLVLQTVECKSFTFLC